ncbi:Crp/Fnr family transcriptional regulator, partial [Bradyrhizobium sp.]|uniref:Crp/Fnr family transcriptional regulator n=1 Tax=Bradyrhizobium sp. TaxID=376 RepID=UPI0023A2DD81
EIVEFEPDEFVWHVGDQAGGVFGIVEGAVGVLVPAEEAGLRLAHIMRTGAWFGYGPLFTGGQRTLTFRTTEPSIVMKIELARLNDVGRADLAFTRIMATLGVQTATIAIRIIHDLLIPRTDRRIAATLLRVADVHQKSRSPRMREIRLNQAELAEMANTSRHSVNRTLRLFQENGWIGVTYRHVQILNSAVLSKFAHGEDGIVGRLHRRNGRGLR